MAKRQSNLPSMLFADVDLGQVTEERHLKDRRPELYRELGSERITG